MANTPTTNASVAVCHEQQKPLRNCDKYRTEDEAYSAFIEFCCKYKCKNCRLGCRVKPAGCAIAWLYDEAGKEATK